MISTIISFILLAAIVVTIIVRRTRVKTRPRPSACAPTELRRDATSPASPTPTPAASPTRTAPPIPPVQPTPSVTAPMPPQPAPSAAPTPATPPTPSVQPTPQKPVGIDGTWQGVLNTGVAQLTFQLRITRDDIGTLSATMGCIEQGTSGIPIDTITLQDNRLAFAIKSMRIAYGGELSENQHTLDGIFTQFGQHFPLTFTRA